jgi:hypothetical protein
MHTVSGGCHCGNIRVELQLTCPPDSYQPRACDCDFCCKHGAAYVSDPQGALRIRIRDAQLAGHYRQGSGMADLLLCRNCGVLVGARYRDEQRLYGVVNVKVIDSRTAFGKEQTVSPGLLSAPEKVKRWREFWFADVSVAGGL